MDFGGLTAGIDLSLALIEEDHGFDIAKGVAQHLVVYHRRHGGQSQFAASVDLAPKNNRIPPPSAMPAITSPKRLPSKIWRKQSE